MSTETIIHQAICDYFGVENDTPPGMTTVAKQLAARIADALDRSILIESIEALDALPVPTPDHLAGVLIKSTCLVDPDNGNYGLGDIYEHNTDGTWCMLQDPSGADWGARQLASKDIPLPAVVLWNPESIS